MADTNHKPGETDNKVGELDRMLDAALAKYAAVEPRAGLEGRILANLRTEQVRSASRPWWQWGLAAVVVVIVIVVVWASRLTRTPRPAIANHPPAAIQRQSTQRTRPAPLANGKVFDAKRAPVRRPAALRASAATAVAARPKLDQFPSPQPLSAEEIALTHYVNNFPKEAQLLAQAQEEFALKAEKEMNDAAAETPSSGSIQQER